MPLQAWPGSPNWGHSACQDAAVVSTDEFFAVVGTVAYITSGCAHDPGIFGCLKLLPLYTDCPSIHGKQRR